MYLNGIKTDHSALFIGLQINEHTRGPSYWKLNTSRLQEIECVKKVNQTIMHCNTTTSNKDPAERWEYMKKCVLQTIKRYSEQSADEDKIVMSNLAEKITEYEDGLHNISEDDIKMLEKSKLDLNDILFKKTQSIMFRSKAKWAIEGEHNTKYFYNLEKARYNSRTCTSILIGSDEEKNPKTILDMQCRFYEELYTRDENVSFNLQDQIDEKLTPESPGNVDVQFSREEIVEAIKGLKNGSCPGSDGLSIEFYKVFWKQIERMYIEMVQYVYDTGSFHSTARTGILNLIPKKDKDIHVLKNLRPITLLNCDYKIVEKMVANRMIVPLAELIHTDQKGFLPGRKISTNIRKILDIVSTTQEENVPGAIVSCDFLKCFDRVEIPAVLKAMEFFNFSPTLCNWVKIMYRDFKLKVQNNGEFSEEITPTRGIHQGGPASNVLFLTVAELLAVSIHTESRIRGIFVKEILHLLNQFADDLDSCIADEASLQALLDKFEQFRQSTGFTLSYEKTTVYRVGSLKNSSAKMYTEKEMNWTSESINVLGVEIYQDEHQTTSSIP